MKKKLVIAALFPLLLILLFGFLVPNKEYTIDQLRDLYGSGDPSLWPAAELAPEVDKSQFEDIGPLPKVEFPEDNPYMREKVALGKMLFFDPRLSSSGQIACASCHDPELAWADGRTRAFGHDRQTGKRNAMTIMNVAFADRLFWDGRAKSLEDQSKFPIADPLEMNEEHVLAVERINGIEAYRDHFETVFGTPEVTLENIQKAIATFERTIVSRSSPFDRFVKGKKMLLSDEAVKGMHLFRTKAGCINCHNTPYFSDNQFHNDGQTLFGSKNEDLGLFHVTGDTTDVGKFRTPTLREVTRTGPWMHHGHFPTLLDVVQYYNLGNPAPIQKKHVGTERDALIPEVSPMLKRLDMDDEELDALLAFLETLSTRTVRMAPPQLPQ
jgi:cytochrome c peroxidase